MYLPAYINMSIKTSAIPGWRSSNSVCEVYSLKQCCTFCEGGGAQMLQPPVKNGEGGEYSLIINFWGDIINATLRQAYDNAV